MADTELVPDDGITAGSRTTPYTVPAVRKGAATAREILTRLAAQQWNLQTNDLKVQNGSVTNPKTGNTITYADLAKSANVAEAFEQSVDPDVALTPVSQWQGLGTPAPRPTNMDTVNG